MKGRVYSFDTIRAIAIIFVVTIHTAPFSGMGLAGNAVYFVVDTTARFAVPLFFLIAGYLFSLNHRGKTRNYTYAYLRRLTGVYVFGLLLALPIKLLIKFGSVTFGKNSLPPIAEIFNPIGLLYYGNTVNGHLWFLPALGYSILFIYFAQRKEWSSYLLIAAAVLHLIGMVGQAYSFVTYFPVNTVDALFFGLFYTTTGYWLEQQSYSVQDANTRVIVLLVAAFSLLHLLERYILGYTFKLASGPLSETIYLASYSLFTPFFAISVMLLALNKPDLGKESQLWRLGTLTVGIYILHGPILQLFRNAARLISMLTVYTPKETIIWHILLTPGVYMSALIGYIALGRLDVVDYFYNYRGVDRRCSDKD